MDIIEKHMGFTGPTFTLKNRLKRALWSATWTILASWTPPFMHKWRVFLLKIFGAKIQKNAHIYASVKVWAPWNLEIHEEGGVGPKVILYNMAKVTIGTRAVISQGAHICAGTHDYRIPEFPLYARPISIGKNAWICASAFIGPGVEVGDGAILSAMSTTFKSLEPWVIYQGNPAIAIKRRPNFLENQ